MNEEKVGLASPLTPPHLAVTRLFAAPSIIRIGLLCARSVNFLGLVWGRAYM